MLFALIRKLFPKDYSVKLATTESEFKEINQFRYNTYVSKMKKNSVGGVVDHDKKIIYDEAIPLDYHYRFYLKHGSTLIGTLIYRGWDTEHIPQTALDKYQLHRFLNLKNCVLMEGGAFILDERFRKKLLPPMLLADSLQQLSILFENKTVIIFCVSMIGLYRLYSMLGMQLYSKKLFYAADGPRLLMAINLADTKRIRPVGINKKSFAVYLICKSFLDQYYKNPTLANQEKESINAIFQIQNDDTITNKRKIKSYIQHYLQSQSIKPNIAHRLLSVRNFGKNVEIILTIQPNQIITREGLNESELFILTEGSVAILKKDQVITQLNAPCILGEVSYLYKKYRTATIVNLNQPARLIVITKGNLLRLRHNNPRIYSEVIHILSESWIDKAVD